MKLFLSISIILLLSVFNLSGKDSHYAYTQLSVNEGLSQANVESILLDQKGDLWIGTKHGLNRYAQQQMENFFYVAGDKNSLPDNWILHLEEDSLGNIWVATKSGLAQYDRQQKYFTTVTRGVVESSLCIKEGIIFGGDNVLYFYSYQTQQLERIHIQEEGSNIHPIEYRVQKILPFKDNKLLIATRKRGMFTYNCQTKEIQPFTIEFPHLLLFSACIASDGHIYASFYGNGICRFDQNGKILTQYTNRNSELSNNYVMDMLEHDGKLWLATDGGGISLIDLKTGRFDRLTHITGDNTSLPANAVTKLYKDYNGNLWAGSVRRGVFIIKNSYIQTFQDVTMNNPSGLTEKAVSCIYEEENGKLWIGTDGGGINLYDPTSNRFTHYPHTYGDKVVSIAGLSDEELLVSLYTKGMFKFNKRTGNYQRFIVVNEEINQQECFYGYLPLANQVSDNKIYILSFGAWVYHIKEKVFSPLSLPEEYKGKIGALKLAYSNSEFSLLHQENRAFIVQQRNDSISLLMETDADEEINTMVYDATNRTVWIGTNHGLGYYHLDKKEYLHYPTNLFNSVSYLTFGPHGKLWICAENKLFSYHIRQDRFTSWSKSDGYLPNEIYSKYQKVQNKDYIYLCGTQGLVQISNAIQPMLAEHPEIYLDDMQYDGTSSVKDIENGAFQVPWNYHSLVLTFGVKSKDVFQKHLFKYTIRSSQGENTFESYEPQLNLSSLSPGDYTILLSCFTKDGSENPTVEMLRLTVRPPWYKSGWFITLMVLLCIGTTAGTAQWIYLKKKRQMKNDVGEFLQTVLHSLDVKDELHEDTIAEYEVPTETTVPEPVMSEADQAFLEKMDQLIRKNLSNDELSAKFLTDHLAMSRASLYNKVKALTGMGVNDYINRIRIERSVHLLTTTDLSINDISYEVGFSYPRYFSTSFKQMKGMTPTQFRNAPTPHKPCPAKPEPDGASSHSD